MRVYTCFLGMIFVCGQVNMCPVLCKRLVLDQTCTMPVDDPELYLECAMTRVMA